MSYLESGMELLKKIAATQEENIRKASVVMADAIAGGHMVHLFGSGHSVIPLLDVFPRYGGIVGFHPLMDPRLMWFNVIGPGGARELLWIERREGYVENFLKSYDLRPGSAMVVYSHGGLNAAPVEAAMYARARGLKVIAVTSAENHARASATHSSGMKLGDLADVLIDNCVPPEDALVPLDGYRQRVGAGSTLATIYISQAFVVETARLLQQRGCPLSIFVSPNVKDVPPRNNDDVYEAYTRMARKNGGAV